MQLPEKVCSTGPGVASLFHALLMTAKLLELLKIRWGLEPSSQANWTGVLHAPAELALCVQTQIKTEPSRE